MSREFWDQWLTDTKGTERKIDVPFLKEILQRAISTVLDVGSGRGSGVRTLAELGFSVTSVDSSLKAVHYLRQISQDSFIKSWNVVCADLLSLPFRDSSFGAVTSFNVMNFFIDESERERAFAELLRVVTPGGIILVIVLSAEDMGAKRGKPLGNGNVQLKSGMCLHHFTPTELEKMLKNTNIIELNCFQQKDTFHDPPHTHAFVRALASHEG